MGEGRKAWLKRRVGVVAGVIIAVPVFVALLAWLAGMVGHADISLAAAIVAVSILGVVPSCIAAPKGFFRGLADRGLLAWLAFATFMALSMTWSTDPEYGATKLLLFLAQGVVPGVAAMAAARYSGGVDWRVFVVVGVAFAVTMLLPSAQLANRAPIYGANAIWLARSAVVLVAVCAFAPALPWVLRFVGVAAGFTTAFVAASRGPLLSLAIGLVIMLILRFWRARHFQRRRALAVAWAAVFLGVIGTAALIQPKSTTAIAESRVAIRMLQLTSSDLRAADENVTTRISLLRFAFGLFAANPLKGVGVGSGRDPSSGQYPHNIIVEIASEGGSIALLLWVTAVLLSLHAARKQPLLLLLCVIAISFAMTSGHIGSNNLVPLFCILALAGAKTDASGLPGSLYRNPSVQRQVRCT